MISSIKNLFIKHPGLSITILIVVINVVFLDIWILSTTQSIENTPKLASSQETSSQSQATTKDVNSCPLNCLTQIEKLRSNSQPQITPPTQTTSNSSVTDTYIPLGSGSSSASDWTNVPGVQANIDASGFGNIQNVYFEASLQTPNAPQNVSVRLYNLTTNQPVWFSNMTMQSSVTSQLLTSNPITLTSGNNLYQVQMMTQLQAPANLIQARIHIVTN